VAGGVAPLAPTPSTALSGGDLSQKLGGAVADDCRRVSAENFFSTSPPKFAVWGDA
jgi:hypothetical protein